MGKVIPFPTGKPKPPEHFVTVRLTYLNERGVRTLSGDKSRPWKWAGECTCGWLCLSWEWDRAVSAATNPAWTRTTASLGSTPNGAGAPRQHQSLAEPRHGRADPTTIRTRPVEATGRGGHVYQSPVPHPLIQVPVPVAGPF